jgi:flagellar hook-length control protein FliK
MSSVRISTSNSGSQAVPRSDATPRAGDGGDPAAGFAAALGGATSANFQPPSDPPSNPDDKPSGHGHAGDASDAATSGDAAATSPATLPGLAGWAAAVGDQAADGTAASTGQHGSAKPGAVAAGVAATAIAAALGTIAAQPAAMAATQSAAAAADAPKGTFLPATGKAEATASARTASGIDAALGDALDPRLPAPGAVGPDLSAGATAAEPSTAAIATDLSAPALTQAVNPAHAQFDPAALAVAAPTEAAALVAPIAASAGGSGGHDFTDNGRDAQAAAAAAFDGVASAGMGPPGGIGAPSIDALATTTPTAAADSGAANVATQISGQMLRLLANSGHEAVMRLNPPDLGEVTVRVAVSGRDVTAWFGSSQPDVQQTISLGLGQLQADLGNAGYSLNGAWVGADTSGFGSRGGSTPPPPSAIAAASAVPVTQVVAALSSTTGVSIYV